MMYGVKANMDDPLARIIAPIVIGQLRSYMNDHGDQVIRVGVNRNDVVRSIAKRIVNDLLCGSNTARMTAALVDKLEADRGEPDVVADVRQAAGGVAGNLPLPSLPTPPTLNSR